MRRHLLCILATLAITSPLVFAGMALRWPDLQIMRQGARLPDQVIVMYGNSVNRHVSKCDADRRTLPEMIGSLAGTPVVDISKGGMSIAEYRDVNAWIAGKARPRIVIAPLMIDMTRAYGYSAPDLIGRHLIYSALALKWPHRIPDLLVGDGGARHVSAERLTYNGRYYGNGPEIQANFYSKEKALAPCPEIDGVDLEFVRFSHWRASQAISTTSRFTEEVDALIRQVTQVQSKILFVLMPENVTLFDASLDRMEQAHRMQVWKWMVDEFSTRGALFMDLSRLVPRDEFVDRWCACGHLDDRGRMRVAREIASAIKTHGLGKALSAASDPDR
jgi:hypothetical protein